MRSRWAVVAFALAASVAASTPRLALAADSCQWLGDDLPLPLPVKTPRDLAFKAAAEQQYLIFNLLAGGKMAWQRGDFATAVQKWEALLRISSLDPQIDRAVTPFLTEARERLGKAGGSSSGPSAAAQPGIASTSPTTPSIVRPEDAAIPPEDTESEPESQPSGKDGGPMTVSGTVTGGGTIGPGGAVIWLRRTDGHMPRLAPVKTFITQRDKMFIPHVLAVPLGSSIEFRNDDRIYHNVFSLTRPNEFDAGVRATGASYSHKFDRPGPVDLLCNIHAGMNAFIYVVDSPLYAKTRATGAFSIRHVPQGTYDLFAWHEAATALTRKRITVHPGALGRVTVTVGGDKHPSPFIPDKYGHKRQAHLGY